MTRNIALCMVVHAFYLKDARVRRYAESMACLGHDVDVICLNEGGEPPYEVHCGVHIHRVSLNRTRGGYLSYAFEYFVSFVKLLRALTRLRRRGSAYDVIHVHNFPNFLVFAAHAHKRGGSKILLDIHDPMPELFMSKFGATRRHPLIKLLRLEERASLKYADCAITVNHFVSQCLVDRGYPLHKIAVVMNSPDSRFYLPPVVSAPRDPATGYFEVLYFGTLAERYGIDTVLNAVSLVKQAGTIPRPRLTIIPKLKDEGAYCRALLTRAASLDLADSFRMLTPVSQEEMPSIISTYDVSVYTPPRDIHMDLALSLKIPEVVAVGRPMVTSRLPVLERYFGDDSLFMFAPGNAQECAARLVEVYERPDQVALRVRRAQVALQQFSWVKQMDVYLGVLETLLD
jgi:glycosyltransferase involved in cell wall biosynthesis